MQNTKRKKSGRPSSSCESGEYLPMSASRFLREVYQRPEGLVKGFCCWECLCHIGAEEHEVGTFSVGLKKLTADSPTQIFSPILRTEVIGCFSLLHRFFSPGGPSDRALMILVRSPRSVWETTIGRFWSDRPKG
jgi:hypothetical protein